MLKLDFNFSKSNHTVNLEDHILLFGSCFSENIGNKLLEYKFNAQINPFGTIYNPVSIFNSLELAITGESSVDSTQFGEVWYDWDAHSAISATSKKELIRKSLKTRQDTKEFISKCKWIILTPGTSWVYQLHPGTRIVANCHKHPSSTFEKRILTPGEIIERFGRLHQLITELNPNIEILFTVSPVRHIRDGLIENNQSKATLLLAIGQLVNTLNNCHYFPSYEIMIDELRDYRFYKEDLIHPNAQAVNYIWESFTGTYMDKDTQDWIDQWHHILKKLNHKSFHPEIQSHQAFLKKLLKELESIDKTVDVRKEIQQISSQIQ